MDPSRATSGSPVQPPPENSTDHPPRKRVRVSLACNTCRVRKSKCDGARPRCWTCEENQFECVYNVPQSSTNIVVGKSYMDELQSRLQTLESFVAQSGVTPAPGDNYGDMWNNHRARSAIVGVQPSTPDQDSTALFPENVLSHEQPPGEMFGVGVASIISGSERSSCFIGPSSNTAAIDILNRALPVPSKPLDPPYVATEPAVANAASDEPYEPTPQNSSVLEVGTAKFNCLVLPEKALMEKLVGLYFRDFNCLYPYLHEPSFMKEFSRALQTGFVGVRRYWLGLLNMIMAISCRVSNGPEITIKAKFTNAEVFFNRSWSLCKDHFWNVSTFEGVHVLLLMCQYLQSTYQPLKCWHVHGLAVRTAVQLGLHLENTWGNIAPLEQELRKRAWWGCLLLDCILSMGFGRPSSIAKHMWGERLWQEPKVPVPQLMSQNEDPNLVNLFQQSVQLCSIVHESIEKLYGSNIVYDMPSQLSKTMMTSVLELQQKLSSWRYSLPKGLVILTAANIPTIGELPVPTYWRQCIILTLRYYNTKTLLYRPFTFAELEKGCNPIDMSTTGPSVQQAMVPEVEELPVQFQALCRQEARKSAEEITTVLYKVVHNPNLLGAWWYTLDYTLGASLVLLSTLTLSMKEHDIQSVDSLKSYLQMSVDIMQKLSKESPLAVRCIALVANMTYRATGTLLKIPNQFSSNPALASNQPSGMSWSDEFNMLYQYESVELDDLFLHQGDFEDLSWFNFLM